MEAKPLLLVLTGTSGSGKTTLCTHLLKNIPQIARIITTTTRTPRPGEKQAVDYFFTTPEKFSIELGKNFYIEHAKVYNHYYGISKKAIEGVDLQKDLVICVDVAGAQHLQQYFRENPQSRRLICVFVSPDTIEELRKRLLNRGTDDVQTIQTRLQMAEKELETLPQFDYYLRSQDPMSDWQSLQHIYFAEKMRI